MVGGCTATKGLTAGSAKGLRIAVFQKQLLWKLTECVCISTFTSFNDYSLNDYNAQLSKLIGGFKCRVPLMIIMLEYPS